MAAPLTAMTPFGQSPLVNPSVKRITLSPFDLLIARSQPTLTTPPSPLLSLYSYFSPPPLFLIFAHHPLPPFKKKNPQRIIKNQTCIMYYTSSFPFHISLFMTMTDSSLSYLYIFSFYSTLPSPTSQHPSIQHLPLSFSQNPHLIK